MKKYFFSIIFIMSSFNSHSQETNVSNILEDMVLPLDERALIMDEVLKHRLDTIVPNLMRRDGLDAWVIISREYNEDPVLKTMLPATWLNARRRTVLIFLDHGPEKGIERMAAARYDVGDVFKSSWDPDKEPNQWRRIAEILNDFDPKKIGLNYSDDWAHADGLTYSEQRDFVRAIPDHLRKRIVSAEKVAVGWLETRTAMEMELYDGVMEIAHGIMKLKLPFQPVLQMLIILLSVLLT